MYEPQPGDRVKVTRYRADGRVHAAHVGRITSASVYGYVFDDDLHGRHFLATSEDLAKGMRGWTQTIEPASWPRTNP